MYNYEILYKIVYKILIFGKYDIIKIIGIDNIDLILPEKLYCINKSKASLYFSVPVFNNIAIEKNTLTKYDDHDNYTFILKEVEVHGNANLIILDINNGLYDLKRYDSKKRYKYTDGGIVYCNDDLCLIKNEYMKTRHSTAICMVGNYSWNYYHLMFEIIVKFQKIEMLHIDKDIPLLIDRVCYEIPQYYELFEIFNNNEREIITLRRDELCSVGTLYTISSLNIIPPNFKFDDDIRPEDILFDINSLEYLRNKLLPLSSKRVFPKRIYISRNNASGRRKFNELAVQKILEKYDFEPIQPELYSIKDQIAIFSNAEIIAGGSGAAFTNLIFCKANCKVIIFAKSVLPFSGFSSISSLVGNELIYITETDSYEKLDLHAPFKIDIIKLEKIIEKWTQL